MANEPVSKSAVVPDPPSVSRGLQGIVAAATQIAEVDGAQGRLTLRGYDVSELSGRVTFEEVAYLLWYGKLPNKHELEELRKEMSSAYILPEPVVKALKEVGPYASGMHIVRIGAAMLSVGDKSVDSLDLDNCRRRAARLQAQMPTLVAYTWRIMHGEPLLDPNPKHSVAESFLYLLEGKEPDQARVDALNAYMVAVSEHGLNASTFTARVVMAADSDMVSAQTAAIGTLKGPRHGGVPGPVLTMLDEIGSADKTEEYVRNEMSAGRRIMGFGHRIYKVRDPRAALLSDAADKLAATADDRRLFDLTRSVEETTVRVLAELKPGRDLYANVELFAALILHAVGVPSELFTPVFAIGRTSGWTAHMIEQLSDNRLIRPDSIYVGPRGLKWCSIQERS